MESKLTPPTVRKEWLARPGLLGTLPDSARVILVSAPAGFGKSTLVAQWRANQADDRRWGWVRLDRGDNDPVRLWRYVITALRRACPEIGGEDMLQLMWAHAPDVTRTVLPTLVNELATAAAPLVLVLEDYHLLTEPSCHDQIAFLLARLPPSAQIVLVSRADPPLPLARLRAAGELAEVRQRDLSFTPEQVAVFVTEVAGVELGEHDLAVLVECTEGWPAGVYLAALSLRGHPSPPAFIQQFSGANRFIIDFLAGEVLDRQPGEVQRFLARTSILDRFCASLCQAVTGAADAAELIDVLERENLFVVPLDENRQWYRYHHLFAALLRAQLARTEPEIVPELHRRASGWHERSGSPREAIGHALAAGDVGRAIDLIARWWHPYVDAGQIATVNSWLRSLGDDQIAASPVAAHCAVWAAAISSDRLLVRRWLPVVEAAKYEGPLPDGTLSLRFSAALLRAIYGVDSLRVMRESAATAAGLADDPATPWYALAREAHGYALYLSGQAEAALTPLQQAVRGEASCPVAGIVAWSTLAQIAAGTGDLRRAGECLQAARELARRGDPRHGPLLSLASIAAGAVAAAAGQLGEARGQLERALRFRHDIPGCSPWPTLDATLLLMQVLVAAGEQAGAAALTGQASEVLAAFPDGAGALQARLQTLERQITGRPRSAPDGGALTGQEAKVLRLLRGTSTLGQLARELQVSTNTIKTQTQAIYRKLGVSTRSAAIERARELGILP